MENGRKKAIIVLSIFLIIGYLFITLVDNSIIVSAAFLLVGIIFFIKPDNKVSKILAAPRKYCTKKVSRFLGIFFLLFSVSALPAIVAENIDDGRFEWLSWVSAGLYVIEMVFAYRYEKKNKLK